MKLNAILKTKTIFIKKSSRNSTYGYCHPKRDKKIFIYRRMKSSEYLEMTWVHEWFHHYQEKMHAGFDRKKLPPKHNPPENSYASTNHEEEECEAFALLMVKRSKEYNLRDLQTEIWLNKMLLHFWDEYPDLRDLLLP
jgi:hypothetical protein